MLRQTDRPRAAVTSPAARPSRRVNLPIAVIPQLGRSRHTSRTMCRTGLRSLSAVWSRTKDSIFVGRRWRSSAAKWRLTIVATARTGTARSVASECGSRLACAGPAGAAEQWESVARPRRPGQPSLDSHWREAMPILMNDGERVAVSAPTARDSRLIGDAGLVVPAVIPRPRPAFEKLSDNTPRRALAQADAPGATTLSICDRRTNTGILEASASNAERTVSSDLPSTRALWINTPIVCTTGSKARTFHFRFDWRLTSVPSPATRRRGIWLPSGSRRRKLRALVTHPVDPHA